MTYTITIDEKTKEAILIALGAKVWELRGKPAYETYDKAYKEIKTQTQCKT